MPYKIDINPQIITLFPGQRLTYSANVTDYFGNSTSCSIKNHLQCARGVNFIFCKYVGLNGDATTFLSTGNITTNVYLTSTVEHHDSSLKLQFTCLDTSTEVYANVNLTICPLGYFFKHLKTLNQSKGHVNVWIIMFSVILCWV